jgi:hypothetical protein
MGDEVRQASRAVYFAGAAVCFLSKGVYAVGFFEGRYCGANRLDGGAINQLWMPWPSWSEAIIAARDLVPILRPVARLL